MKKFLLSILIASFLFLLISASPVSANGDNENVENFDNRLSLVENQLSEIIGSIDSINESISGILDMLAENDGTAQQGSDMTVFAISPESGEFVSLSFQALGTWQLFTVNPGSWALVCIVDSDLKLLPLNGTLELSPPMFSSLGGGTDMLYQWLMMGQGGFGGGSFSVPVQSGMSVLMAPESMNGLWSGTVSVDGYNPQSFFYMVGETSPPVSATLSLSLSSYDVTSGTTVATVTSDGEPVEASVYVDGIEVGKTGAGGALGLTIELGSHSVYAETSSATTTTATVTGWNEGSLVLDDVDERIEAGKTLKGNVLDSSSRAISGVIVRLGGRTATTDAWGRFELSTEGFDAGTYSLVTYETKDESTWTLYRAAPSKTITLTGSSGFGSWTVVYIVITAVLLALVVKYRSRIKEHLPFRKGGSYPV